MLKFYILLILYLLISCSSTMKTILGYENPYLHDDISLKKFIYVNKIDSCKVLIYEIDSIYQYPEEIHLNKPVYNRIFCFNKNGYLISANKNSKNKCFNALFDIFDTLNHSINSQILVEKEKKLFSLFENTRILYEGCRINKKIGDNDFIIVIYWATWHKKFTLENIEAVKKIVTKYKKYDIKIDYLLINTDLSKRNYPFFKGSEFKLKMNF